LIYYFLYPLHEQFIFFNVVRYITFRTAASIMTALIVGFVISPWFIRVMSRRQLGQNIREEGPAAHKSKAGTPTMGGIVILLSLTLSTILWARLDTPLVWIVLFICLSFGLIGFCDDYLKLRRKNAVGLSGRFRLILELLIVSMLLWWFHTLGTLDTNLAVPFFKSFFIPLGPLYIIFGALVVVGAANAVNLTDGLDGLAIGPIMSCALGLLVFAYVAGHAKIAAYLQVPFIPGSGELAVFCGAMFGAGLSFLWYNTYPAQVFMGDIGSLALGAAIGTVALLTKNELVLVILGGIFVLETFSVIAQVFVYKLKGKRVFKMAPIHHHFELKGWAEPKVIVRFWIISIVLTLVALSTLKLR